MPRSRLAKYKFEVVFSLLACLSHSSVAADLARLQSLLQATPEGGWAKASLGSFSAAWPTGATAAPPSPAGPEAIIYAWSSFAWDSTNGNLLIYGGGHANYVGNEVYSWSGTTGFWSRGSLPSYVDGGIIPDNSAPQSAHTYDNNVYLPVNKMFLTLGGGAQYQGGPTIWWDGTQMVRTDPWVWDPAKADPNKVGGSNGSGWDPATLGGNMWMSRNGSAVGQIPGSFSGGTTAYLQEGGKDVVYASTELNGSGFPWLYRYTLGDIKAGGLDTWEVIGKEVNSVSYRGTATIDSRNYLFIRTSLDGLAVWNLANANILNPLSNIDTSISLLKGDGSFLAMNDDFAVEYDSQSGNIILWDGNEGGAVWSTKAVFGSGGQISNIWPVERLASTTVAQPHGNYAQGVMGKLKYIEELDAFMVIDEWDGQDASVWLYKPITSAVPEPASVVLFCLGGLVVVRRVRRQVCQPECLWLH